MEAKQYYLKDKQDDADNNRPNYEPVSNKNFLLKFFIIKNSQVDPETLSKDNRQEDHIH